MPATKDRNLKGKGFVYFSKASPKSPSVRDDALGHIQNSAPVPPIGRAKSIYRKIEDELDSTDEETSVELYKENNHMCANSKTDSRIIKKETLFDIPSNLKGVTVNAEVKLTKKIMHHSPRVGPIDTCLKSVAPPVKENINGDAQVCKLSINRETIHTQGSSKTESTNETLIQRSMLHRNPVMEYRQFKQLSSTSSWRDVIPDHTGRMYPSIPKPDCTAWITIIIGTLALALFIAISWLPLFTSLGSPEYAITRQYVMSLPELQRKYNIGVFELTNLAMMEEQYRTVSNESVNILHETMTQYKPQDSLGYYQMALAYNMARYRAKLYIRSRGHSLYYLLLVFPMQDMYKYSIVRHSLSFSLKQFLRHPLATLHNRLWDGLTCIKQDEKLPCPSTEFLKERFEYIYGYYPQEDDVVAMKLFALWQSKL